MRPFDHKKRGFTLIEMMVAVFVFSIVMTIATGAIFSIVSANKTSQALKSVMDNLSSAIDSMSRDVRYGSVYHCGGGAYNNAYSCPEGTGNGTVDDTTFAFLDKNLRNRIIYTFQVDPSQSDRSGYINKCIDGLDNCDRLTAPEVHIKKLHFYVQGARPDGSDIYKQPLLLITISGYAKVGSNQADFNIETMVDQRVLMCKDGVRASQHLSACP